MGSFLQIALSEMPKRYIIVVMLSFPILFLQFLHIQFLRFLVNRVCTLWSTNPHDNIHLRRPKSIFLEADSKLAHGRERGFRSGNGREMEEDTKKKNKEKKVHQFFLSDD